MIYCAFMKTNRSKTTPFVRVFIVFFVFSLIPAATMMGQVEEKLRTLPHPLVQILGTEGSVGSTITDVDDISLAPAIDGVDEAIRELDRIGANIISERLILVEGDVSDRDLLRVYNALLGVSDLAGLEYLNIEKNVRHTLFDESYRIDSPDDRSREPDLSVTGIPPEINIYVFQQLPPFGDVVQDYGFVRLFDDGYVGFAFSSTNREELRYRRIRVVKPGEMRTYAWFVRGENYILMYGIGAARVFTGFGLFRDRIENSFTSRTNGLFDWLSTNYLELR
jgi:hypothetical protein